MERPLSEALPHDDRAGTHDSADGRSRSYASIGRGQAALWITSKNFLSQCVAPWKSGTSATAAGDGAFPVVCGFLGDERKRDENIIPSPDSVLRGRHSH